MKLLSDWLRSRPVPASRLPVIQIEVTSRCQTQCVFCSGQSRGCRLQTATQEAEDDHPPGRGVCCFGRRSISWQSTATAEGMPDMLQTVWLTTETKIKDEGSS
jgi:hypothetical protein